MKINKILLPIGFFLLFFAISWRSSVTTLPKSEGCCEDPQFSAYCAMRTDVFNEGASITSQVANGEFQNYQASSPADAVGFTMDRKMVNMLANKLLQDGSLVGVRIYPGKNNNTNELVATFLKEGNGSYEESSNNIYRMQKDIEVNPNGNQFLITRGPCPRWCDLNSRTVVRPK
jgi:hypothetical protein